ncbi:hypothetical protein EDB86DRAFT_2393179 [Lactarius hatsudake]|nr:hypothetical protein EDB86DRAFT_2393179 [Lactarius hatsudake]
MNRLLTSLSFTLVRSRQSHLVIHSKEHPIFVAQGNAADLALAWHSKASRPGAHALSQVSATQPTARRGNDDSERTRSSLARLTASATMRDTPSAVSEQASVGSGKMKGHRIRTLDAVLLVLYAHDTNRGRGKLVEEQVRGGGHAARVRAQQDWCVIVCLHPHTQPPPTMCPVFFLPSRLRSNTSAPWVHNLSIFNTTREFTKTLALVS